MTTVSRGELQRADHIYTDRTGGIYHHGIYVGKAKATNPNNQAQQEEIDDAVIHFFGPPKKSSNKTDQCPKCFLLPQIYGVVVTCLDCFLLGHSLYVYKYDGHWKFILGHDFVPSCILTTDTPDIVVGRAFSLLEKKIDFGKYNFLFNNCEDFATYCKTGIAISNQAAKLLSGFGFPGLILYNSKKV